MVPRALSLTVALAAFASIVVPSLACTNVLVSAGASHDGAPMLAYNADSGSLYGSLGLYPRKTHPPNTTRDVWDWDDSVFLGTIPEAEHTYNVVGNANEFGLIIGETTFGGLPELDSHGTGGIMDYGSLIWITLQRCNTCDCAIDMIDGLVQTHGYASDGESFSCVDTKNAWLMELIGKGKHEKGAVWVATRVPEGAVLAHANQARTSTFALDDPANVRFSKDVVSFARKIGRYPESESQFPDSQFDFTSAYDPVTFGGARHGEARVWDIYRKLVGDHGMESYLEYAKGFDLGNRMPLFVFPTEKSQKRSDEDTQSESSKLSIRDVIALMRSKLEDSWFDPRGILRPDVGAGPGHSAYRARPLTWRDQTSGKKYANERTVSTQQTAWTFVGGSREYLPDALKAVQWFAPDDSGTSLRAPIYGGATRVPFHFADATGQAPGAAVDPKDAPDADALHPSLDSAFWVWNLVSSFAYGERALESEAILEKELTANQELLLAKAEEFEAKFLGMVGTSDAGDASLRFENLRVAESATVFCEATAEHAFHVWRDVFLKLFAATRDGFAFTHDARKKQCPKGEPPMTGCTSRLVPEANEVGYDKAWRARIAADSDNDEHYEVPETGDSHDDELTRDWKRARMEKRRPTELKARLVSAERKKVAEF